MKLVNTSFISYSSIILISLVAFVTPKDANAFFYSFGTEESSKVATLPDTYEFKFGDDYVDIGVIYERFEIVFLPIWQSNMRYIAIIPNDNSKYYDLTEKEIEDLAKKAGIALPLLTEVKLNFWHEWGGKLILVFLLFLLYRVFKRRGHDIMESYGLNPTEKFIRTGSTLLLKINESILVEKWW